MVKYICDRCGVCPSDDYKSPTPYSITHSLRLEFLKNEHTVSGRNFDLCDKCMNDAVNLTDELSKVFRQFVGKFITEKKL